MSCMECSLVIVRVSRRITKTKEIVKGKESNENKEKIRGRKCI